jgi:predicted DCC family thiol-disulfide oxidoreductase YuxK
MKTITIFYDNWCPHCTRFNKLIKRLDWFNKIQSKQLRNQFDTNQFPELDINLANQQMASFNGKYHYGYNSLYYIFCKLPLFWLLLPLFFVLRISKVGQFLYVQLALKRKIIPIHCDEFSCEIN